MRCLSMHLKDKKKFTWNNSDELQILFGKVTDGRLGELYEQFNKPHSPHLFKFKPKKLDLNQLTELNIGKISGQKIYRMILKDIPKEGKILEVGCGRTYLPYLLIREGYYYYGIDVMADLIKACNQTKNNNLDVSYKERITFQYDGQSH